MALPHGTTGSLTPSFNSARPFGLAVKQASTFTLDGRLPTALSLPLHSSVSLSEETDPFNLTSSHCSLPRFIGQGEMTNANMVVFHRWPPPDRNQGIKASHLSNAVHNR